jgi:hypothetical protein
MLIPQTTVLIMSAGELVRMAETWREPSEEDLMAVDAMRLIEMGCEYVFVTGTPSDLTDVANTLFDESGVIRHDNWQRISGSYSGAGGDAGGHHCRIAGKRTRCSGSRARSTGIHDCLDRQRATPRHGPAGARSLFLGARSRMKNGNPDAADSVNIRYNSPFHDSIA